MGGFLGLLTGAVLFGLTYQKVFPGIVKIANYGNVIVPDLWRVDPFLTMAAFGLICLFLFYLFEHGLVRKERN
ncbi:MAG: hypothetical protein M1281_02270 [Chloroflexi bacterium]|nr:hypothetical protein [Chloroflexota bacterium]